MGIKQSLEVQCQQWRQNQWEGITERERNFGRCNTLRNHRTGALVDQYQLSWTTQQQYSFYLKSFNWRSRRNNTSSIVKSIFLKQICKREACSGKYAATIYLEHIALRLSQIQEIPIVDSLYILLQSLQGYAELYQHAGYFRIQQQQICIDRGGKVKVWVNSDLSKNYPECDSQCGYNKKDQTHMVEHLVDAIQTNTDQEEIPSPSIKQYFNIVRKRKNMEIGFEYAKIVIIQYAKMHQIRISNRFDAVIQMELNKHVSTPNPYQSTYQSYPLLPQNNAIPQQRHENMHYQAIPRLNISHSSPNFYPNSFVPHNQYQYQEQLRSFNVYPTFSRPQSPTFIHQNPQIIPEPIVYNNSLQPIQQPQYSNQQTKRKSKNSKNSKSQMICMEETTQNQSLHFNQQQADDRNTMKSMPIRGQSSTQRDRLGYQRARYSQCEQQLFSQHDFQYNRPVNHDAFGLIVHPRKKMKQSNSSYKFGSSNSSQNHRQKNNERHSKKSSSKRQSIRNQLEIIRMEHENLKNQRQYLRMERQNLRNQRRNSPPRFNIRYYATLGEELEIDPEIQADIRKYLG